MHSLAIGIRPAVHYWQNDRGKTMGTTGGKTISWSRSEFSCQGDPFPAQIDIHHFDFDDVADRDDRAGLETNWSESCEIWISPS